MPGMCECGHHKTGHVGIGICEDPSCECETFVDSGKDMELSDAEVDMVNAINRYRRQRKLPMLWPDETLMTIARLRVSVFDHNHPQFGWCHEHARRLGYKATDNIAQGYPDGVAAVGDGQSGWGDEREGHTVGHDMQMKGFTKENGEWVDQKFDKVGVAIHNQNYIAVFGRVL